MNLTRNSASVNNLNRCSLQRNTREVKNTISAQVISRAEKLNIAQSYYLIRVSNNPSDVEIFFNIYPRVLIFQVILFVRMENSLVCLIYLEMGQVILLI